MNSHEFKVWRTAMGWSQAEAAEALGISKPSVENYERGKRREDDRAVGIPLSISLACSALYHRLEPWEQTTVGKKLAKDTPTEHQKRIEVAFNQVMAKAREP